MRGPPHQEESRDRERTAPRACERVRRGPVRPICGERAAAASKNVDQKGARARAPPNF